MGFLFFFPIFLKCFAKIYDRSYWTYRCILYDNFFFAAGFANYKNKTHKRYFFTDVYSLNNWCFSVARLWFIYPFNAGNCCKCRDADFSIMDSCPQTQTRVIGMVAIKIRFLKSILEKSIGLLGSSEAHSVYFKTRFGIHTFFMKFPIDVLILDDDFTIVKYVAGLVPNRIFFWNPRLQNVIELPTGEIQRKNIKIGDKLTLQYE